MDRLSARYHRVSFRGRLLLLLVAVSLIQASVAAYTFFELQSKPAEQRVQAQLNAALRGVAPVVDSEMKTAAERLETLTGDPSFQDAITRKDWVTAEGLLGNAGAAGSGEEAASNVAYIT